VTGAILASLMFSALVNGTKKAGFLPEVQVTDGVAQGTLVQRDMIRGRPVHIQVGDLTVGHPPTAEEKRLHVYDHLFGSKFGPVPPVIEMYPSVNLGDEVIVKHYRVGEVDHYELRPVHELMEPEYDARPLPRFLFFGAGLMTFGVLFVLRLRVRDLTERGINLIQTTLFGPRFTPEGLTSVPGDGPVVLRIETTDPAAIRAIRSAVDRYVVVFEPKTAEPVDVEVAKAVLARGDVVGVMVDAPASGVFVDRLDGLKIDVQSEERVLRFRPAHSTVG
jgi:hypothetical protein